MGRDNDDWAGGSKAELRGFSIGADRSAGDRGERAPSEQDKQKIERGDRLEKMAEILKPTMADPRLIRDRNQQVSNADVKEAREYLKLYKDRSAEQRQTTKAKYTSTASHLAKLEKLPEQHATNKHSYDLYRAALVADASRQLKDGLNDRDRAQKQHRAPSAAVTARINDALTILRAYPPGERAKGENFGRETRWQGPQHVDKARKEPSAALEQGWQAKTFEQLRPGDRAKVAVLAVTGARPAELKAREPGKAWDDKTAKVGVSVKAREDGGLEISRFGAKLGRDRGIAEIKTTLTKDQVKDDRHAQYLYSAASKSENKELRVVEFSPRNLTERVSRAADRAGVHGHVTAYDYRHAYATRAKTEGQDRGELAAELGQRDRTSTATYGRAGGTGR